MVQSHFKARWTSDVLLMGSCKREAFPYIHHTASSFKKIIRFLAAACQGEIKNLPCLVPGLRARPALMLLKIFLMTLFWIQAVAMAHFLSGELKVSLYGAPKKCPWSRNGQWGRWEHLPLWSPPL